jgi:signal transduction histidine kinase
LISNAIKYADLEKPEPAIRIAIELAPGEAAIQFSDNGIGIEKHHLGKIFDMFYRANHDAKGSGLGLFIFSETIQKLKGQSNVESQIKEGTTFFIRLPNLLREYQISFDQSPASTSIA